MKEVYWKRPFDSSLNDEERQKLGMEMYTKLQEINPKDQMTFANKTAMWVAYERQLESERPDSKDRLFEDPLAKYFAQPYGKQASDAFACMASSIIFDPTKEIPELRQEGFALYHAARTKLISVHLEKWLKSATDGKKEPQVINLGAGVDTRAFWDESLKTNHCHKYIEVDTKEVQEYKQKVLDDAKSKGDLPPTMCERHVVSMDFAKESTKDLPSKGVEFSDNNSHPTCWILEGLIMYLEKDAIDGMLTELSKLSSKGSYVIINFADGAVGGGQESRSGQYCQDLLTQNGWTFDQKLYFGDPDFSFDRYPEGKPPNPSLGFLFCSKN